MRKALIAAAVVLVLGLGGLYFHFAGKEYVYRFSEQQLQEKLSAKLPLTRRYLILFEVSLDNPRVALENGSNRVSLGLDVVLNVRVEQMPAPLGGSIDVSGGLLYVPEQAAFFLTDPVIERLEVQGIPAAYTERAASVSAQALGEYYKTHPLHTLSAVDAKQVAARLVLKSAVVEKQTLVETLGI